MDSTISTEGPEGQVLRLPERMIPLGDLGALPETVLHDYLIAALVGQSNMRKRLAIFVDSLRERLGETLPDLTIPWLRSVTHSQNAVWHLADLGAVNPQVMRWRIAEEQYLEPPPDRWGESGPPYPVRLVVLPTALCGYSRYELVWDDPRERRSMAYRLGPPIRNFVPWMLCREGWQRPMCARCEQAVRSLLLPPLSS